MFKYLLHVFTVVVAVWSYTSTTNAQEQAFWNVRANHFECLQANISAYEAIQEEKVVIFLAECPEVDITKILEQRTENSALPTVKKENQSAEKPAEVIIIDRKKLSCIANLKLTSTGGMVNIPKDPCG